MVDRSRNRWPGDRQRLDGSGDSQDHLSGGVVEDEQGGARCASEIIDLLSIPLDQLRPLPSRKGWISEVDRVDRSRPVRIGSRDPDVGHGDPDMRSGILAAHELFDRRSLTFRGTPVSAGSDGAEEGKSHREGEQATQAATQAVRPSRDAAPGLQSSEPVSCANSLPRSRPARKLRLRRRTSSGRFAPTGGERAMKLSATSITRANSPARIASSGRV